MEALSEHRCFDGLQGFYRHDSRVIGLPMRFSLYLPPQARQQRVPALFYLAGLTGNETPCFYDCTRGGWLQRSVDGRLLFVGDSGDVIETATRKVLTTLSTLAQTKKSIEVDWQGGVPIATSGRTGVGGVG